VFRRPGSHVARVRQEIPGDLDGCVRDLVWSGLRPEGGAHEEDWERDMRLERLMERLGLPAAAAFSTLSGGLKRRVLLAQALAGRPDLLLLDEPTNHLDVGSIEWLETFLLEEKVPLFFVTHDRSFLRRLATRIVELDRGVLTNWDCPYDTYLVRKQEWLEAEERRRAAADKKLAQEEEWIRRGVRAQRSRAGARIEALAALRAERRARRERQGQVRMQVADAEASGVKVIEAIGATFAYPDGPEVVRDLDTRITRGDKVGIIGPNGAGKTTLIRLLLGQLLPTRGNVVHGTNLEVLYLDQLRVQIDDRKTVAENVADGADVVTVNGRTRHVISYLQDFLFEPARARTPAGVLSGGERNRLLLARLFTKPANVLVLDEPTNDLDLETVELLENLLVEFSGTLLVVSHDRQFLDEVVTGTLVFEGEGRLGEYVGGYTDWQAEQARKLAAEAAEKARVEVAGRTGGSGASSRARKLSNREKQELAALPARIEALEQEQAALTDRLADPGFYQREPEAVAAARSRLADAGAEHEALFARWCELEELAQKAGT
jgi:ABC transport system ATP-binding/permease protein